MRKKLLQGLAVGLCATALALGLWAAGWLDRLEWLSWDARVQLLARPGPATGGIRLILLDQNSLDWGKEQGYGWPWPRTIYQRVVDYCRRQGAASIMFDVVFTEPSAYGVEDDLTFAAAISNAGMFAGTVVLGSDVGSETAWPEFAHAPEALKGPAPEWLARAAMPTAAFPTPEIAAAAARLGNVQATPDPDGIFRRVRPFVLFDGRPVPALGAASFLAARRDSLPVFEPGGVRLGSRHVPVGPDGGAILRYRGPISVYSNHNAAAVVRSQLAYEEGVAPLIPGSNVYAGCHVVFGFTAPGLYDLRPTPVNRKGVYPGLGIQATLLDNLLSGDFMRAAQTPAAAALIVLFGVLWGLAASACRNARETVAAFLIALPIPALAALWAYARGWWLPFAAPEAATALALVGAVLVNYATEGRQKRFIKGAFQQYLNEDVIRQLLQDPGRLKLGGEMRTLSIFFSDLQGFTSISEGLNPEQLISLMNEYLTAMTDIIQEEGGTLDKYEGDAIIAFWNAPLAQDDHAVRAVRAALRCQAKLADMRPGLAQRLNRDLFMRIGLNTGPVVVGNMGSHKRFNYTIMGDAANLASRLEGINKQFGSFTLISEAVRDAVGGAFPVREISRVAVVGRKAPIRVFEPMLPPDFEARRADLDAFAGALKSFYRGDFAAARAAFEKLRDGDPVSGAYARKCRALEAEQPASWDGVWVMTEK
ncbi:MAG: adenylate/guanylate cyclase domain-containing protein [Lentisphaerae bacterium]|nr:adenylate/guanylate cyclase domain-containing protein [Lentisphaerota bacterium]